MIPGQAFFSKCQVLLTSAYTTAYINLPKLHKDPFDHMLLAQAITSPMRLITADQIMAGYSSLVMVI